MKIAIIGHKEIPSRKGGVEVVVEKVSTMLVNKGHTVDVYNRKHIGSKNNNVKRYKGVKLINVPTININGLEALIYSFIATLIAILGRYDVMYYHAEGPASMCFIPYILGIKTVVTIHGLDWKRSKWNRFAKMYLKFGEKMAAKYADEIIVLSEDMRQYFLSTYNRETTFIANGIEKHEYKKVDEIEKKWNLKKDDYILYVGRIVPEKGIHYLIDAFKDIKTDKKLVIAGDTSYSNEYLKKLKEMAKQDNRIVFTGFVMGRELEELYSNCFMYCLPSEVEGMSMSLLEAMSYGCTCLVSDIKENMQVIRENGYGFKTGNINHLKEQIQKIVSGKLEKFDSNLIKNYTVNRYSLEETVEKTEKILLKNKEKKKFIYYFFIVCMYIFAFQNWIQKYIPIFKYFDEFLALIAIPILCYSRKKSKGVLINKDTIVTAILLLIVFILGITSNLMYKYRPLNTITEDVVLIFKFFVVYYLYSEFLKKDLLYRYKRDISKHAKILILFLFLFTICNYVFNIFDGEIRIGIKSNQLMYEHTTYLVAATIFLLVNLVLFDEKIISKYIFMALFIIVSTLRAKAIGFCLIYLFVAIYVNKNNKKISILKVFILGIVCLLVGFKQIYFYYFEVEDSARAELLKTSVKIADEHFPLGGGFSSFGSYFSIKPYSILYAKYNIQNIHGLQQETPLFICDSFWPMILGEFGYIGLICYTICIILILKNIQNEYSNKDKYLYIAKLSSMLYLLISSTAETAFVGPNAVPLALIMSVSTIKSKRKILLLDWSKNEKQKCS